MPRILDLFCGAGGAGEGYARAGFKVYGADLSAEALEHNPHWTAHESAFTVMMALLNGEAVAFRRNGQRERLGLRDFDAIHASPPCQHYSSMTGARRDEHPNYVPAVRYLLELTYLPYVIENVPQAPLRDPLRLCGSMFPGLMVRRHRDFESNVPLTPPRPCHHKAQGRVVGVYGDHADSREFLRPDGTRRGSKATSLAEGQAAMGIDWMPWPQLKEAIPPAYTEHIGRQLIAHLGEAAAA